MDAFALFDISYDLLCACGVPCCGRCQGDSSWAMFVEEGQGDCGHEAGEGAWPDSGRRSVCCCCCCSCCCCCCCCCGRCCCCCCCFCYESYNEAAPLGSGVGSGGGKAAGHASRACCLRLVSCRPSKKRKPKQSCSSAAPNPRTFLFIVCLHLVLLLSHPVSLYVLVLGSWLSPLVRTFPWRTAAPSKSICCASSIVLGSALLNCSVSALPPQCRPGVLWCVGLVRK